ncbi:MAG: polyprenyl synthetase family protein [Bacteroidota bacterium]
MKVTDQQRQISKIIEERLADLNLPEQPSLLYDPVRYTLSLTGKRVRPYLTLIGAGLCEGHTDEALPAAISIELLHNFTLLHDDIMDCAEKRRGEPSVYKKWDSNTAILSGDAMYAKAFKQLQYYGESDSYTKEQYKTILDIFLDSAERVCEGQAFDLMFEDEPDVSIEAYLKMIEGKTAALISGALTMGGAVAGATENTLNELRFIGRKAGVAFQIQDDLLDAIADPDKFGKKRGGDIIEGKKTYLTLLALERCNNDQKKKLINILADPHCGSEGVDHIIRLYEQLNVLGDTEKAVQYHYQEALEHLDQFDNTKYKNEIISFFNRLISREF